MFFLSSSKILLSAISIINPNAIKSNANKNPFLLALFFACSKTSASMDIYQLLLSWSLSAAPRMSPKEAPESVDPYCSTASFSSANSNALIDRLNFLEDLSKLTTLASILSPQKLWPLFISISG